MHRGEVKIRANCHASKEQRLAAPTLLALPFGCEYFELGNPLANSLE